MKYKREKIGNDEKRGICRVLDVCFENTATDDYIDKVFKEIFSMEEVPTGLMTGEALCRTLGAPKYVLKKMEVMEINSSFTYEGTLITRWGKYLYNGFRKE